MTVLKPIYQFANFLGAMCFVVFTAFAIYLVTFLAGFSLIFGVLYWLLNTGPFPTAQVFWVSYAFSYLFLLSNTPTAFRGGKELWRIAFNGEKPNQF